MTHTERKYTIGRSASCDIVLADVSVSRVHAELTFMADGKLLVTDCRSTQGTFLIQQGGGERVVRQELVSPLDSLRFGAITLQVKELLQAIHLKYPPAGGRVEKTAALAPLPPQDANLVRCECGAVKVRNNRCEVCRI